MPRKPQGRGKPDSTDRLNDVKADGKNTVTGNADWWGQLPENAIVDVRRRDPRTKNIEYCFALSPADFQDDQPETILQHYGGGGTYYLVERRKNPETGKWDYVGHYTVYVAGEPRPITSLPRSVLATPGARFGSGPDSNKERGNGQAQSMSFDQAMAAAMFGIVDQMRQGGEMQMKAMEVAMMRMLQPQRTVEWDKVLAILAPVAQAMLTRDPKPDVDVLGVVKQVAELLKVDKSLDPVRQLREHMGLITDWVDLKGQVKGDEEDPVYSMVKEYMPKLLDIIKTEQAEKGRMPTEAEVHRRLNPPATAVKRPGQPLWARVLMKYRAELVNAAMRGDDAGGLAEAVARLLPEQVIGSVLELLRAEDNGARVIAVVPELEQYPSWTTAFLTGLWETLGVEEEGADEGGDTEEEGEET